MMNPYPLLVFVHVVGAVGIFAALSIEGIALRGLRRETAQAGAEVWMGLLTLATRAAGITMGMTIAAGMALMITAWHHQPWITAAFVGIAAMAILGVVVSGRRLRRLRTSLAVDGTAELSNGFQRGRSSHALATSLVLRIATGVGILGLMTAKPDATGSALILAVAVLAGIIVSAASWRPRAA